MKFRSTLPAPTFLVARLAAMHIVHEVVQVGETGPLETVHEEPAA